MTLRRSRCSTAGTITTRSDIHPQPSTPHVVRQGGRPGSAAGGGPAGCWPAGGRPTGSVSPVVSGPAAPARGPGGR
ncbi:hypothetical protein DLE60_09835 [Micromonospora globispora]|nr:hypothetical protein DLE60_09835 [Micromonospora globispora]RQW86623.1 hypothetical protein DKL51_27305 [Micromonospora globispora]